MKLTGDHNQCQGCKAYFNSSFAFDKHRTGEHGVDRRCMTEQEMTDRGMAKNAAGYWVSALRDPCFFAEQGDKDREALRG
jgi:hypothetical protein